MTPARIRSATPLQKIYQEGVGFVTYDLSKELPADTEEREWAQAQLRAERKRNLRLGIVERLDVTMARVQAMHQQHRVQARIKENEEAMAEYKAQFEHMVSSALLRGPLAPSSLSLAGLLFPRSPPFSLAIGG